MFLSNSCHDVYMFSSLTQFPFYDVDFGWGKPEKVSVAGHQPVKNFFLLMDNKSRDEVEVISCMKKQDMLALESDE